MALADATDGRVTGHLADVVEVQGQHQGLTAHPGCSQRGFDTSMAGSDNDHVVHHTYCLSSEISGWRLRQSGLD